MSGLREKLTYGNVTATLALCLALTGAGYAAGRIHGSQLENRSVAGKKLKRDTLTGREVRESRLRRVPRARAAGSAAKADRADRADVAANAEKLNGVTAQELRVQCAAGLLYAGGVCFEQTTRDPLVYKLAVLECAVADSRRLPTHNELLAFVSRGDFQLAEDGELTSNVIEPRSPTATRTLDVVVMTDDTGSATYVNASGTESRHPYRCVEPAKN